MSSLTRLDWFGRFLEFVMASDLGLKLNAIGFRRFATQQPRAATPGEAIHSQSSALTHQSAEDSLTSALLTRTSSFPRILAISLTASDNDCAAILKFVWLEISG